MQHSSTVAKYAFQKVQMPTAAEVKLAWKTPPSEYGPEPYFGMNGAVTIESLAHDLDTMKGLGFHAVTAQAGGGMTTTYLTPEYFAFFKQFALEAKKRDMKVWIVDDIGYPSGFAGGYFTKEKPELRMQALSLGQRLPVKAGETLNQAAGPDAVAAVAVSATGERVPVPIADGNIAWTAPAGGDWTVMVVEHVFRTSPTRSDANPTHAKDASNSLEDYMNPEATAAYLGAHAPGLLQRHAGAVRHNDSGLPRRRAGLLHRRVALDAEVLRYLPAGEGLRHSAVPGRDPALAGRRPREAPGCLCQSAAPQSDPAFIPAGPPMPRPNSLTPSCAPRATTTTSSRRCSATASSSRRGCGARRTAWSTRCI